MTHKIGMPNPAFEMASVELTDVVRANMRPYSSIPFEARFHVQAGPMRFNERTYNDTFVLTVDYEASQKEQAEGLPLSGFGSNLSFDYMEKAAAIADEFCERNGLRSSSVLASWPLYQAVVFRPSSR